MHNMIPAQNTAGCTNFRPTALIVSLSCYDCYPYSKVLSWYKAIALLLHVIFYFMSAFNQKQSSFKTGLMCCSTVCIPTSHPNEFPLIQGIGSSKLWLLLKFTCVSNIVFLIVWVQSLSLASGSFLLLLKELVLHFVLECCKENLKHNLNMFSSCARDCTTSCTSICETAVAAAFVLCTGSIPMFWNKKLWTKPHAILLSYKTLLRNLVLLTVFIRCKYSVVSILVSLKLQIQFCL